MDRDWWICFYWVFIHGIKIFYMRIRFCFLRLSFVMTVLWQYSYWRGLHSSLSIRVFFLLFCFLIIIGIMSHEIANLGNSFSQILHFSSYHLLIAQCHLHIIPLQYMSWRVSCFYVLSAYPRSYNSDQTNNNYVFVVLFIMKIINVFFKHLKGPLTLLTIDFFIEHWFNVSP